MMPGGHPKPIAHEENESNNTTAQKSSNETSKEEPTADQAMLNILKVNCISFHFLIIKKVFFYLRTKLNSPLKHEHHDQDNLVQEELQQLL